MARPSPLETANALFKDKYPDAKVAFLAGSVIRGEDTEFSDLDIVVVYEKLERAYRDSFIYDGWPVEVFVQDPETIKYFFEEVDGHSGVPSLPNMVAEGLEIPRPNEFSKAIKAEAKKIIA